MSHLITVLFAVFGIVLIVRILESRSVFGMAVLCLLTVFLGNRVAGQFDGDSAVENAVVAQQVSETDESFEEPAVDEAADSPAQGPATVDEVSSDEPHDQAESSDDVVINVDPGTPSVVIPKGRPAWVESEPVTAGDVHTIAVASGPHERRGESLKALDEELRAAVDEYIDDYLGDVYGENFKASSFVNYDLTYIKSNLLAEDGTYDEVIQFTFGPMHQSHALIEIDEAFRNELESKRAELDQQWRKLVKTGRLAGVGFGSALLLGLLGVVFGYFRVDTATRGYYTGRLQLVAATMILALIVAGVVLAQLVPWVH